MEDEHLVRAQGEQGFDYHGSRAQQLGVGERELLFDDPPVQQENAQGGWEFGDAQRRGDVLQVSERSAERGECENEI